VGEVLERHGRKRVARFRDGVHTVDRMIVPLDEASLDVRAHLDLDAFRRWLDDSPDDAATGLLTETDQGVDEAASTRRLSQLGIPSDDAARWWREVAEPLLRQRGDVEASGGEPAQFRLRVAPGPTTCAPRPRTSLRAWRGPV
jgi:hypothetical protein